MPQVSTGLRGLLGVFEFGSKHTTAQAAHISLWCDTYAILVRCLENNITTLAPPLTCYIVQFTCFFQFVSSLKSFYCCSRLPLLVLTLDDDPTGGGVLLWQVLLLDF